MTLDKLVSMDTSSAIEWLACNKKKFSLISESELGNLVEERDLWEGKATELAHGVGFVICCFIGEHSSINCPVQNAIDAIEAYKELN